LLQHRPAKETRAYRPAVRATRAPNTIFRDDNARLPASLADEWYVVCRSTALRRRPIARIVAGRPLVLFRTADGRPAALDDRCAHRNAPLSLGRLVLDSLECPYHGWRFDGRGRCRAIPGLLAGEIPPAAVVAAHPTVEQQGLIWTSLGTPPAERRPFAFRLLGEAGYSSARIDAEVESSLLGTLENVLDVLHTSFLHRGLFRGGERRAISATVRARPDGTEVVYEGEPRPSGVAARLLSIEEGIVDHVDRFVMPSVAEVEYRLGASAHLLVSSALTPVEERLTRLHTVVSWRSPLPAPLVRLAVEPLARWILRQDARILRAQSATIRRFGGASFVSTSLDLLGPEIERWMREGRAASPAAGSRIDLTV
jgi:phenylpropionate dioxygenase-like ring-hydroxylating dioxygenase large terminal subunit